MRIVRYLTKEQLIKLNNKAIETKRNRSFDIDFVESLSFHAFPIIFTHVHNEQEIRALIQFDDTGKKGCLDMSFKDFYALPKHEIGVNQC